MLLAFLSAWILAGCGGGGQAVDARGSEPLLLQPSAGDVFRMEAAIEQTMRMTVMEQTVEILQEATENTEWRVQEVHDDGSFRVQYVITRFRLKQEGPGVFESYDTADTSSTPQSEMSIGMSALANVPLTMEVSPVGDISIVGGMDALYNNMVDLAVQTANQPQITAADRDTMRAIMREALPGGSLEQDVGALFYAHTSRPVAPGSTWTTTSLVPSDLPLEFDASVRFDSLSARQMFLRADGDVRTVAPDSAGGLQDNSFRDINLSGSQSASLMLHRPSGFPIASTTRRTMEGSGVIDAGGSDLNVDVSITATTTLKGTVPAPTETPPQ
jgi:hypothetical protein